MRPPLQNIDDLLLLVGFDAGKHPGAADEGIERGRVLPVEARLLTAFDAKLPPGAKPDGENPPKKIVEKATSVNASNTFIAVRAR